MGLIVCASKSVAINQSLIAEKLKRWKGNDNEGNEFISSEASNENLFEGTKRCRDFNLSRVNLLSYYKSTKNQFILHAFNDTNGNILRQCHRECDSHSTCGGLASSQRVATRFKCIEDLSLTFEKQS